jgi:tetratricopeptide (TPR) repeat protein
VNIALAMQVRGSVKESLPIYEKALAINPLSKVTRHGFASALNRSEYYVDAAREFHKLLEVYQDYVPAHLGLAVIYSEHLKVPEQAEGHYRRILELNPQHPEAANIRQWLFNNNQR